LLAPLYVAIDNGYFENGDINVDTSSGSGIFQVTIILLLGDSEFTIVFLW